MKKEYYYGILPLALTSCLVSQTSAQERQINRPNVVFIYADDIGYGDLSCNGAKTIHTPNVERLAKMGVRFTNAHSAAATSTPSRYAMLTGEYAWRKEGTGIADGDQIRENELRAFLGVVFLIILRDHLVKLLQTPVTSALHQA